MLRAAVAISVVLAIPSIASRAAAQPGLTPPAPAPAPAPTPTPPPRTNHDAELSEGTALALSLGGTAAAWGLIFASANAQSDSAGESLATIGVFGTFFAPSFGHWYAHSFGTRGMAIRAAAVGGMVLGAAIALSECPLFSEEDCNSGAGEALIVGSFIAYLGGTLDDIVMAPRKARRYNERHRELAIVPVVHRDAGTGVAVVGRF